MQCIAVQFLTGSLNSLDLSLFVRDQFSRVFEMARLTLSLQLMTNGGGRSGKVLFSTSPVAFWVLFFIGLYFLMSKVSFSFSGSCQVFTICPHTLMTHLV